MHSFGDRGWGGVAQVRKSEHNVWGSVRSSHSVGSADQAQAVRRGWIYSEQAHWQKITNFSNN